jgi:hypothetical protein
MQNKIAMCLPDNIREVIGEKLILLFAACEEKLQERGRYTSRSCPACSNLHALRLKKRCTAAQHDFVTGYLSSTNSRAPM